MKIFIQILGLAAACMAGGIESSGSHDQQGGSNGWQPSNVPAVDYSHLADNGKFLAGLSQDYQALSHGDEASSGHSFKNIAPQPTHSFGQDASHGYDFSNHGQAKSFDVASHSEQHFPSFAPSGNEFNGDSYLKAANDFGNHDQSSYNVYAGNLGSQGGNDHGGSSHASEEYGEGSTGHGYESQGHLGGAGIHGNMQAFILHDGGQEYGHGGQDAAVHDLGVQGFGQHDFGTQGGHGGDAGLGHAEPFAVGEHTDTQNPVEVPHYKHVTVPFHKTIHVNVPKPILVGIPQPYPVKVPVNKPVAVPVETEINIPIEKVVPYPVVKHVPYPVEKHVPFKVEKTVHVHVPQPYPVKIPIYKTIHHHH